MKPRAGEGYATVAEELHRDEVGWSYTDVEEQNSYAEPEGGCPGNKGYMDDVEKHTEGKTQFSEWSKQEGWVKAMLEKLTVMSENDWNA